MVTIAFKRSPSATQASMYGDRARQLRAIFEALNATTTPWGHVWTVHMPQFIRKWGTLFPFACQGVENRHRHFKVDLRLSAGNQWRNGNIGFAHCLVLDQITWALREKGVTDEPRYSASRGSANLAAYRAHEAFRHSRLAFYVPLSHPHLGMPKISKEQPFSVHFNQVISTSPIHIPRKWVRGLKNSLLSNVFNNKKYRNILSKFC